MASTTKIMTAVVVLENVARHRDECHRAGMLWRRRVRSGSPDG